MWVLGLVLVVRWVGRETGGCHITLEKAERGRPGGRRPRRGATCSMRSMLCVLRGHIQPLATKTLSPPQMQVALMAVSATTALVAQVLEEQQFVGRDIAPHRSILEGMAPRIEGHGEVGWERGEEFVVVGGGWPPPPCQVGFVAMWGAGQGGAGCRRTRCPLFAHRTHSLSLPPPLPAAAQMAATR